MRVFAKEWQHVKVGMKTCILLHFGRKMPLVPVWSLPDPNLSNKVVDLFLAVLVAVELVL